MTISFQSILDAETRIGPYKIVTPLLTSDRLNQSCLLIYLSKQFVSNAQVLLNLETPVTLYFPSIANRPILAYSWLNSNHAQAVALAARLSGRKATIVIPVPFGKDWGTRSYGADVVLYDRYTRAERRLVQNWLKNSRRTIYMMMNA